MAAVIPIAFPMCFFRADSTSLISYRRKQSLLPEQPNFLNPRSDQKHTEALWSLSQAIPQEQNLVGGRYHPMTGSGRVEDISSNKIVLAELLRQWSESLRCFGRFEVKEVRLVPGEGIAFVEYENERVLSRKKPHRNAYGDNGKPFGYLPRHEVSTGDPSSISWSLVSFFSNIFTVENSWSVNVIFTMHMQQPRLVRIMVLRSPYAVHLVFKINIQTKQNMNPHSC